MPPAIHESTSALNRLRSLGVLGLAGGAIGGGPRAPRLGRRHELNEALWVVGFYITVSFVWLLLSDAFVGTFFSADLQPTVQSLKGIGFVSFTAVVLLFVLLRYHARMGRSQAELENLTNHLAAILTNAPLPMMTLDRDGMVVMWNPAAEHTFGWSAAQIVGKPNPIVAVGDQEAYSQNFQATLAGESTSERRVSRLRADGSAVELRRWTAPLRDRGGDVVGAVAMFEDVTRELSSLAEKDRLIAALDDAAMRQIQLAAALERMTPSATPEDTAEAICREVSGLEDVATVGILSFGPTGVIPLATVGPASQFVIPGRRLSQARSNRLMKQAALGAWTEEWIGGGAANVDGVDSVSGLRASGLRAGVYVPIRGDNGPLGVIGVGGAGDDALDRLRRIMPALMQVSSIASALLLPSLRARGLQETVAGRIRAVIKTCAFEPVFQPIVELATGRVAAYEALTRFSDGTPPDVRFADAESVGLGHELEVCCLTAQVHASVGLPDGVGVSLNVSPGLVIGSAELPEILRGAHRPVILEITEHVAIPNYPELRHAIDRLVPKVRLAVDDAGAGFASLRHVVELRPNSVKLDQALVRSIETDLSRQALVAGMRHFAEQTGAQLIAEGIETEAERSTLVKLGVEFGQGYLLGRPERLPSA